MQKIIIYDLMDERFCKYIYLQGKNKDCICVVKYGINYLCRKHFNNISNTFINDEKNNIKKK
jgi:hypothetical protein